jgi:hypothetical protein
VDKWETLRTVLSDDLAIFKETVQNMELSRDKSILIAERQKLEIAMIPFAVMATTIETYLELMDEMDKEDDGGTAKVS